MKYNTNRGRVDDCEHNGMVRNDDEVKGMIIGVGNNQFTLVHGMGIEPEFPESPEASRYAFRTSAFPSC